MTFGYPRINGQPPKFKSAHVYHPAPGHQSGSPDCAKATAEGSNVVVTVTPVLFARDPKDRNHALDVKMPS